VTRPGPKTPLQIAGNIATSSVVTTSDKMYTISDFWTDDFYKQCSPVSLFDSDDCVLTDVNLSDASEDNLLDFKKKFSYSSLHSDGDSYPNSPINDMDTDFAGGLIVNPSDVKVEPPSPSSTPSPGPAPSIQMKCEPDLVIKQEMTQTKPLQQQSVLKQPTILITSGTRTSSNTTRLLVPKLPTTTTVKLENGDRWRVGGAGGVVGPTKILVSGGHTGLKSSTRRAIDSHLISNNTGSDGELYLTEEEKRTLITEGYSIPKKLPLTKAEERSLKKIRRKIKNKISAQESRRKKKEYLDLLERKYEAIQDERNLWRRKCEELEMQNKELQKQLVDLKSQIIDFDDVDVAVADSNFDSKAMETIENDKTMLEIPDPFDIDVD